jgi:hypothetical protein
MPLRNFVLQCYCVRPVCTYRTQPLLIYMYRFEGVSKWLLQVDVTAPRVELPSLICDAVKVGGLFV